MIPVRVVQAAARFVLGVVLERRQAGALWAAAGSGLAAFAAPLALRVPAPAIFSTGATR